MFAFVMGSKSWSLSENSVFACKWWGVSIITKKQRTKKKQKTKNKFKNKMDQWCHDWRHISITASKSPSISYYTLLNDFTSYKIFSFLFIKKLVANKTNHTLVKIYIYIYIWDAFVGFEFFFLYLFSFNVLSIKSWYITNLFQFKYHITSLKDL